MHNIHLPLSTVRPVPEVVGSERLIWSETASEQMRLPELDILRSRVPPVIARRRLRSAITVVCGRCRSAGSSEPYTHFWRPHTRCGGCGRCYRRRSNIGSGRQGRCQRWPCSWRRTGLLLVHQRLLLLLLSQVGLVGILQTHLSHGRAHIILEG